MPTAALLGADIQAVLFSLFSICLFEGLTGLKTVAQAMHFSARL
jgi:hypothetical protein